jgi:hypothetical protein
LSDTGLGSAVFEKNERCVRCSQPWTGSIGRMDTSPVTGVSRATHFFREPRLPRRVHNLCNVLLFFQPALFSLAYLAPACNYRHFCIHETFYCDCLALSPGTPLRSKRAVWFPTIAVFGVARQSELDPPGPRCSFPLHLRQPFRPSFSPIPSTTGRPASAAQASTKDDDSEAHCPRQAGGRGEMN